MRRGAPVRVLVLLLCGTAALAAWFAGSGRSAATGNGWSRTNLGAVSQPAPVGGKFALYARQSDSLQVLALNASDGTTAWVAPASPGDVTPGVPVELAVRAGTVFYLEPYGTPTYGRARVAARDAASGNIVWQSAVGSFETWPEICPDQTDAVCVNGKIGGVGWGQLRFSATTGDVLGVVQMGTAAYPGRELGPDLFDPGKRSPEQLLAVSKGKLSWKRNLSAIFTLPHHPSSDGGWNFDRFGRLGLFVGSVGKRPQVRRGRYTARFGPRMTVAFSTATGKVKWRTPGLYSCGQPLPCPGRSEAGYTSASTLPSPSVGIRILERGTASGKMNGGFPTVSHDASATIQGFNPVTGKTQWSFKAGRNVYLLADKGSAPETSATTVVLKTPSGYVALNLRTGKAKHLAATTHAWCLKTILYHLSHTIYYAGRGEYIGQQALYPCTLGTRRAAVPGKLPSLVRLIGASTSGMTAWTDTGAVYGRPS
ncbi:MAG TPA: PQQ-binding-like beta-propeller repeat protein [Gaiellaceae bacterium]|nr:PQQ-binding-like beta-propeller repeat protein [Gaiellaceae bacterium]